MIFKSKIGSEKMIKNTLTVLEKGGIIMHATETCYGFACDAFNKKAIKRLYTLKKMNAKKPSSIMVTDLKTAQKYGKFNNLALKLARKYWPGPLTIIVQRRASLPKFLNPSAKTIGIRCPNNELTQKILKAYNHPIITTSANLSGEKEIYSVRALSKKIKPDLIIDSGTIPHRKPSTIVSTEKNKIEILRQGTLKI